jgi:acetyl-CoA carboxylase biotin carboxyl carrier protein
MRPKEIKKLIELVEQSNINELEVSRWGKKVRILKSANLATKTIANPGTVAISSPSPAPVAQEATSTQASTAMIQPEQPQPEAATALENIVEVRSPMVGTFYHAPAPDAEPYVQVGDIVTVNQVLCIIEAMKLMNEIESEWRGRIKEILIDNSQPVEYNQVLFRIEKL